MEPEQDSTWWNNLPQIGTFYDETHQSDKYFIIVNRRCQPSDTISPTVTIEASQAVSLCDQVTGETLFGAPGGMSGCLDFSIRLPPGGGRLFSLIPGQWCRRTDLPLGPRNKSVKDGGALTYGRVTGNDTGFVYAFKGNNTCEFYRYAYSCECLDCSRVDSGVNGSLKKKGIRKGSSLVLAGNGKLYAAKGNNCRDWWQYDPASHTWTQKTDVPTGSKAAKEGAGAVAVEENGTRYVYFLKGSGTCEFYRYNVGSDAWATMAPAPGGASGRPYKNGSCIAYDGGDTIWCLKGSYNEFAAYSIAANQWTSRKPCRWSGCRVGRSERQRTALRACLR